MTGAKEKADAITPAHKITPSENQDTGNDTDLSTRNAERIAKHRQNMPKQFRRVYDIAMTGRSLRAAVNSQCAECMAYVLSEVRLCVSPECPLFQYRPVQGVSYNVRDAAQSEPESTNSESEGNG